ncbi:MAG: molybdopterin-dependent oxidoreductase [Coriobacteriales bacterium]
MSENIVTRRSFLAGAAGVAATCAVAGGVAAAAGKMPQALAEVDQAAGQTRTAHSLCNACSSKCGFKAYVVDGKLDKLIGDPAHPYAKGKLCARGYGYSQIAYSPDRLTAPLKKGEDGRFQEIGWEQAYAEIAEKVHAIIAERGPEALALVHDPRPSGKYYAKRFMNALGSANVYTHGAACNLSKESGFTQAIGAANFSADVANAKMIMFIGRSYCDAIRPSAVAALQKAHANGAHIVIVDPRCNNSMAFADEWVPIRPGTDLALILAMSNVLVSRGLYDKAFVKKHGTGFGEWEKAIAGYTPLWAQDVCGIDAAVIERLAVQFAQAAPAASIEAGWRAAYGCAYANSGETARALCLFNTLLGCWNQKGGSLLTASFGPGELDAEKFPAVPAPAAPILGSEQYPLALSSMGSNVYAAQLAHDGRIKGMFFYNSNMAAGYSNPAYLAEALGKLELMVVCDVQMSETAQLADYVLPECVYLERMELPEFIAGKVPAVTLRDQVLERPEGAKSVDEIFSELAEACGVGDYFRFTVEELAEAELQTVGLSLDALRQAGGTVAFPEKAFTYGSEPVFNTPTGKVQFCSEACAAAGLSPCPVWVEPAVMPKEQVGELRLIGGKQPNMSHTMTANIPELMNITEDYDLARVWISAEDAAKAGVEDGDEIIVYNDCSSGHVRAKVTQRIRPGVLFMPSHYGCSSPELRTANGVGLRIMDFVPFAIEPGYGSAMSQEAVVTIMKAGA